MRARTGITPAGMLAAGLIAAGAAPASAASTPVGVSEREFRISLYRTEVTPGSVRFNVMNFGEDVHDLTVLGPRGRTLGASGEIKSGRRASFTVRLARTGTYRVLCLTADHAARGMATRLRVRSRTR